MNVPTLIAGFAAADPAEELRDAHRPAAIRTREDRGDTLPDVVLGARISYHVLAIVSCFRVRVHVDEAGRHDQT